MKARNRAGELSRCGLRLSNSQGLLALGPGYDHSVVPNRTPLIVPRESGALFERNWTRFLRAPSRMLHIETWNEFHEGTDIADSREYGRQYIGLNRKYSDMFRAGIKPTRPRGPYSDRKVVSITLMSTNEVRGLKQFEFTDGATVPAVAGGKECRAVQATAYAGRYVYFQIDDSFKWADRMLVDVEVEFRRSYERLHSVEWGSCGDGHQRFGVPGGTREVCEALLQGASRSVICWENSVDYRMHSKRSTITQSGAWSVGRKLAIVLGLLAVSGACASPLKRSDVAPQPTWVLHFDFDALRPTRVGEFLLGQFEKPEVTAQNAVFDLMPNLNVRKELHGATLYNTGLDSAAGVLLVYADLQQEKLAVKARAESQYRSSKYKNYVVHSWVVPKQTRQTRVYAAVAGQRVIIGELLASVERALDVLNGSGSLATSKAYPQLGMGSSSIQGISQQLELSEANPSAIMLRLVKGMAFEMAETGQRVSARLKLEAGSETAAGSMLSAAHGLLALAKVQWAKPEAAKLAEAITLQQDSRCVIGKLSMNSAEFVGLLSASASRRAEHNK